MMKFYVCPKHKFTTTLKLPRDDFIHFTVISKSKGRFSKMGWMEDLIKVLLQATH